LKRFTVLAAAVVMQLCLGGVYAWSIFVPALRLDFGFSSAQTQLVFGTAFLVFTVSGVFTGALQDRHGPRWLGVASGAFLAAGYLVASASGGDFALLWLGYGGLVGLGIGCGYVCTIATAVKWFPERKGLVAGLAVAGYGAGAIALSAVAESLLARGWGVLEVLGAVGWSYGPLVAAAGLLLTLPPAARAREPVRFERRRLLRDPRFRALSVAMFCGTLPGLLISGNLKPIGLSFGLPPVTAALSISAFAVGSGGGRIVWGLLADRLGCRRAALLALVAIAASPFPLLLAGGSEAVFLAAALLAGFCYGSSFAIYPAQVAELWGARVMGTVYALVMVAHGLAAEVGPGAAGLLFDLTGSFTPALLLAAGSAAVGWVAYRVLLDAEPTLSSDTKR